MIDGRFVSKLIPVKYLDRYPRYIMPFISGYAMMPDTTPAVTVLKRLIKTVPDALHTRAIGLAFNRVAARQTGGARLEPLEGRRIEIVVRDTGNHWRFTVRKGRLEPDPRTLAPDVRIEGDLKAFLLLATRSEDADTLFFARQLAMEGDTQTGLYIKNLLDALEFDVEEPLRALIGERLAARLSPALQRARASAPMRRLLEHLRIPA